MNSYKQKGILNQCSGIVTGHCQSWSWYLNPAVRNGYAFWQHGFVRFLV